VWAEASRCRCSSYRLAEAGAPRGPGVSVLSSNLACKPPTSVIEVHCEAGGACARPLDEHLRTQALQEAVQVCKLVLLQAGRPGRSGRRQVLVSG
jgi:hypothetical protein